MMIEKRILIRTIGEPGEESLSCNSISNENLEILFPIISRIKNVPGFNYPTGYYYSPGMMYSPEELYGDLPGFELLDKLLPNPPSGFSRIEEIEILNIISRLI